MLRRMLHSESAVHVNNTESSKFVYFIRPLTACNKAPSTPKHCLHNNNNMQQQQRWSPPY
jgi:hypothetical protein